ncbi:hypothetical protein DB88DRAFT_535146 [Papiliotrema laurentii]|uniref:DNA repair protein REV1 n=1 Tax=Papiliotrema laurentii TaxID=5418 RepID=A0AAD9D2W9_PAPLA|nr:hypothetical protein DB88DRAFT_535146 [Papiliotrema laurentii]
MVPGRRETTPTEGIDPSSSSFPVSSPSFWTEALDATETILNKHARSHSTSPRHDVQDVGSVPTAPPVKRARFEADTSLTYLPNRTDILDDDPHSYLANPEYAPNRFGDIGDYMRKKEIKVQTQNRDIALASALEGVPQIFAGLSFYINGNTHPPMEELRKMILQRGGEVRPVLRNKGMVKFIIAPMLTQSKFKQFERYKVVREGWILESCKEGKLLDWSRWKLQPEGGWESEGRKGLEGFLAGRSSHPTSTSKAEEEGDNGETSIGASHSDKAREVSAEAGPKDPPKPIPAPAATSIIPISPGAKRAETPMKEQIPANVQRPEGGWWEHYYTKDSNEDAARLLKDKEWRLKNTAERGNEGGFIDGYYQNSRLHHLSTWKAELKVLVAAAQKQSEEQSSTRPSASAIAPFSLSASTLPRAAQTRSGNSEKVIFHVDFDCFFVSCGLATRPHLRGKPAVVCHSQVGKSASSTSEIASASYEARAKGVKNGMSLGRARTLVGDELETIPYEFDTYKKFSLAFYTVLMGYADELQAVSVDEALIDVTSAVMARASAPEEAPSVEQDGAASVRDPAIEVAEKIRDEVRGLTQGCEVSIGIAHNILLAKLGTRRAKPAGVYHVVPSVVEALLAPLDVEDLPSIGYSIRGKIEDRFKTTICGDLLQYPKGAFKALLGPKTGEMLWGYIRGIDDRKLEPHKERKSISAEMNYGIRFQNQEQAEMCVADLAAEVSKRMRQVNARGRLLTLKLMSRHPDAPVEPPKFLGHGWCETFNRSTAIANKGGSATDDAGVLALESVKLLRAMKLDPKELRGVGIQITKLDGEVGPERAAGQGTLSFGVKRKRFEGKDGGEDTTSGDVTPDLATEDPDPGVVATVKPDEMSIEPSATTTLVPSIESIPPPARSTPPLTRRRASLPEQPREAEMPETPPKAREKHAAAHITRQLRPKLKTQMKAAAVADLPLYGAWARAGEKAEAIDLTENDDDEVGGYRLSEIRELGLDPGVFKELPEDLRKEIIEEERRKNRQRQVLYRPADTSRLKSVDRDTTRTGSLSPARSSRAGSAAPHGRPLVAVSLLPKPSLLKATSLPDILDTIDRWIDSRKGGPPAERDAAKVKLYLVKCLDEGVGVGAVENAVEVLRHMRLEIEDRWPTENEAGQAWWNTWRDFVRAVNERAVLRFGAPLRL